jgi:nicotinate-nucleotide--dimethylbenzimidazole phosphoribosyltransferase
MSPHRPHTVLILGGIRSGKSEFAESLVVDAPGVRYVVTAVAGDGSDAEWAARLDAHRARRPLGWMTDDIGAAPDRLGTLIKEAGAEETVLVDDVGGWLTALLADGDGEQPDAATAVADLVAAVESAAARVIIVSPEVGLSLVPTTPSGRWFADAVGSANRDLAAVVDAVALVVAGRPLWLSAGDRTAAVAGRPRSAGTGDVFAAAAADSAATHDTTGADEIHIGMTIPAPDSAAATAAEQLAQRLPVGGPGIGGLTPLVKFAAATQGGSPPRPYASIRVVAITGAHTGDIGAGGSVPGWAHPDSAADSALAELAAVTPGVTIELLEAGVARPVEDGDVMTEAELAAALALGWRRAQSAADRGDDLIILAAGGPGVDAAAAAVLAGITRAEVAALLPRVYGPAGELDDRAWMTRVVAIRDAVTNLKSRPYDGPTALTAMGGPTLAAATGLLLGAAQRRTPVIVDGPVGAAASLAARDYAAQVRLWCLLTDVAGDPAVRFAADRLGFEPVVSIGLGLGEGANALALLPMFQAALTVAGLATTVGTTTVGGTPDDAAVA